MAEKNKLYFIGNAHLDPVWMWRWQEGSAEASENVVLTERTGEHNCIIPWTVNITIS